jgi:thioredoxin 1
MILLKLYQPNCRPCVFVDNFLQEKGVEYESINVADNPDVAAEFGIMATPVTILLDDLGLEVKRSSGFNPTELEELISQL